MQRFEILLLLLFGISFISYSQQQPIVFKKTYNTQRILETEIPTIDGKLDDAIWNNNSDWESNFIQREPVENASPSEETSFKIYYDSKYMYIGIKNLINNQIK